MNTYRTEFFALCPSNGIRIKYELRIETPSTEVVHAEHILMQIALHTQRPVYHEALADQFVKLLPGRQILSADHHGVHIETTREKPAC